MPTPALTRVAIAAIRPNGVLRKSGPTRLQIDPAFCIETAPTGAPEIVGMQVLTTKRRRRSPRLQGCRPGWVQQCLGQMKSDGAGGPTIQGHGHDAGSVRGVGSALSS